MSALPSMSRIPASVPSVALEISTVAAPIAAHVPLGPDSWFKTHRRVVIIVGIVAVTVLLAVAGILAYFVGYKPSHSGSSGPVYNQKEFQLWMSNHGKSYTSESAQTTAFNNWLANLQSVHTANQAKTGITYAMGPYADLNGQQFQQQILTLQRTSSRAAIAPAPASSNKAAAASLNWADNQAVVSPVKNQGQCGDCWAFATAEAFEVAYNVAYQPSTSIQLSPQQLTACDTSDKGCNGGDPVNVYQNYLATGSGTYLTTEANYPFTSSSGTSPSCDSNAAATGFVGLQSWSYAVNPTESWSQTAEDQLIQALQTSPVTICIDASPWQNYAGGVLSNTAGGCTASQSDVDHAVQLVGYTSTYWIVKNQWSTSWGEKGYIYLARGANTCCIFCEATQVTVTSTQGGATTGKPATTTANGGGGAATTTQSPASTTAAPATDLPTNDPYYFYYTNSGN